MNAAHTECIGGACGELYVQSGTLAPPAQAGDMFWDAGGVDLAGYAGRQATVQFEIAPKQVGAPLINATKPFVVLRQGPFEQFRLFVLDGSRIRYCAAAQPNALRSTGAYTVSWTSPPDFPNVAHMRKQPRRTKDADEMASMIQAIAEGEPLPKSESGKTPLAVGKVGGSNGGKARAAGMTAKQLSDGARKAAMAHCPEDAADVREAKRRLADPLDSTRSLEEFKEELGL